MTMVVNKLESFLPFQSSSVAIFFCCSFRFNLFIFDVTPESTAVGVVVAVAVAAVGVVALSS